MIEVAHSPRTRAQNALARSLAKCGEATDCAYVDPSEIARVAAAIHKLPQRQREVFTAARFHDRSLREVAQQTGLTLDQTEREFVSAILTLMRHLRRQRPRIFRHR